MVLEEIQSFVENLHKEDNRQYISKIVDQKNGVDLFLSTNQLLNYIISNLRGKFHFFIKRSKKLVGRDTQRGKNIYRLKAVLKFLPINKDDVILIDNHQYSVEQILKNKIILKSEDNKKITKCFQDFFNSNFLIMESGE
jgi:NMD protein affecting ribosome stability and mRNA decay